MVTRNINKNRNYVIYFCCDYHITNIAFCADQLYILSNYSLGPTWSICCPRTIVKLHSYIYFLRPRGKNLVHYFLNLSHVRILVYNILMAQWDLYFSPAQKVRKQFLFWLPLLNFYSKTPIPVICPKVYQTDPPPLQKTMSWPL